MTTVDFTYFRKNASTLLTRVEEGERIYIRRHGKNIVVVAPIDDDESADKIPSWKKKRTRLVISGRNLSGAILDERDRS